MQAIFTLTPAESKRLIGMAVAAMPEVQKAKKEGYLIIGRGSTNAYIAEELLNQSLEKEKYVAGQVIRGTLCALHAGIRIQPITFYKDEILEVDPSTLIGKMGPGDVLLKGANAIDHTGKVGVVMASPVGGTMGEFYMAMKAQGVMIIYPVGLEKLIPSVDLAAKFGGRLNLQRSIGARVGFACVADGKVITEIQCIYNMFGIRGVHFASGGYGGAEGAITVVVDGEEKDVNRCLDFIESIKGEPALPAAKGPCKTCPILCSFQGKEEDELPAYLK
jgi:hypothetical protein